MAALTREHICGRGPLLMEHLPAYEELLSLSTSAKNNPTTRLFAWRCLSSMLSVLLRVREESGGQNAGNEPLPVYANLSPHDAFSTSSSETAEVMIIGNVHVDARIVRHITEIMCRARGGRTKLPLFPKPLFPSPFEGGDHETIVDSYVPAYGYKCDRYIHPEDTIHRRGP